ncbi:DsbA family protein [Cryptosporangium phraense]|uniref:Disulfide bond formation protein DsbA n=1 Tax=Cryptosporangium phraense TaxID=2593070 RepID=A0A545B028_9ACTN|nr:thioredoxin domain-containing protein [Cryptosporangium phraense]TQS46931.1 disulfide bond formation protein DsbA [Cryptosporangium phraense]
MTEAPAIDLNRHVYGNPDAEITVVEYGDLECPYCGAAAPVLHELVDSSNGRVRLVFRHFPLFEIHPFALTAALAAESTGEQFWDFVWVLFKHQAKLSDPDLQHWAEKVGVADPASVTGEAAQAARAAVEADYASGVALGVRGTPTLCINDRLYTGRVELRELRAALGLTR